MRDNRRGKRSSKGKKKIVSEKIGAVYEVIQILAPQIEFMARVMRRQARNVDKATRRDKINRKEEIYQDKNTAGKEINSFVTEKIGISMRAHDEKENYNEKEVDYKIDEDGYMSESSSFSSIFSSSSSSSFVSMALHSAGDGQNERQQLTLNKKGKGTHFHRREKKNHFPIAAPREYAGTMAKWVHLLEKRLKSPSCLGSTSWAGVRHINIRESFAVKGKDARAMFGGGVLMQPTPTVKRK